MVKIKGVINDVKTRLFFIFIDLMNQRRQMLLPLVQVLEGRPANVTSDLGGRRIRSR